MGNDNLSALRNDEFLGMAIVSSNKEEFSYCTASAIL